jgi:hypothetical protein
MVDPTKPSLGFRVRGGILNGLDDYYLAFLPSWMKLKWMSNEWSQAFWTFTPFLHLSTGISGAQTMEFTIYYLLSTAYWLSWADVCCHEYFRLPLRVYFYLPSVA